MTVVVAEKVLESKEYYMDEKSCPLEHTEHARHCSLLENHKIENSGKVLENYKQKMQDLLNELKIEEGISDQKINKKWADNTESSEH